jgi:dTDP-4-dehydrorhamnose 3,5-epimerase
VIEGVRVTPLTQISDNRGQVMHMLSTKSTTFLSFGEIYFSCTNPGVVKAWYQHKKMIMNFAVVSGELKLVLYDDRGNSISQGQIDEMILSPENYFLVTVPPKIWYGFKTTSEETSILANCTSIPHDPLEIVRIPSTDSSIPYSWETIPSKENE